MKAIWDGEKIRALRAAYGESQSEFHRRLGVTLSSLAHWEQGNGTPGGAARLLLARLEEDMLAGKIREMAGG